MSLILASSSPHRKAILESAGVPFIAEAADIDEREAEKPLLETGAEPGDIAEVLATAKALGVSARNPDALILGCDQTLSLDGVLMHKSPDMEDARKKLLVLRGKTHQLHSAFVLVRTGQVLHSQISVADMTMRDLTPAYIGQYLAACGPDILGSVGCYQIEGRGIQLFEHIVGDHYTIIGLPLLPLLAKLRHEGLME